MKSVKASSKAVTWAEPVRPMVRTGRQCHGKSILDRIETLDRHVTEFSDQGKALALLKELRALVVVNNYILEWKNTKFFKMLYPFGHGNEMRPVLFKQGETDGNFITHIPSRKTYRDTQGFYVSVE